MQKQEILDQIAHICQDTLIAHLDIQFTDLGEDFIEATMPVHNNTFNPARTLHGGAMMALAESLGSALSLVHVDREKYSVRGLEINGNHVRATTSGSVTGRATLVHKGKQTHVSDIRIYDNEGNLVNISRMTNIVVELK